MPKIMNQCFLLLVSFLLISTPPPSASLSFLQYRTLFSLAHSLAARVSNLRAARGDAVGSERARKLAAQIDGGLGLGLWGMLWSLGWGSWDYLKNYTWRRDSAAASSELLGAVSDLSELIEALSELTRVRSEEGRVVWVKRNYENVLRASKSLLGRLLKVFNQPGPLREVIEALQKEVVEGELVRDCLELGSHDLKGLMLVLKEIAVSLHRSPPASSSGMDDDL